MPTSFSRSLRSLEADRFRGSLLGIAVGLVLLALWLAWFFFARVALYEISDQARIEVGSEHHAIMSPVSGRVRRYDMELDREVREGDVLLELDDDEVRFRLEETKAELQGLRDRLAQVSLEIDSQRKAVEDARSASAFARGESGARHQEALEEARFAEQEAERLERLQQDGLVPKAQVDAARTEHLKSLQTVEAEARSLDRLESEWRLEINEKQAEVAALERQAAALTASVARLEASRDKLAYEHSLYTVRAPASGRIGDRVRLSEGEVVDKSQHIGTVIPAGDVRVVGEFAPSGLGRIRPHPPAKLRLTGFSWVQYGAVPATVTRVGKEPQNGTVRVELSLDDPDAFAVDLDHGLPGTLQIEVERISPAALVLRAAGQVLTGQVPTGPR